MKLNNNIIIRSLFVLTITLVMGGCGKKAENDKEKSVDMVTVRTLGLAYLEEGKLVEAETEFLKLIGLAPNEALGYANLGLVYLRQANYDRAQEQLRKALDINPDDPEIRLNLAEIYELTQRNEEALTVLESTLKTSPGHARTLYKLAQIHGKTGSEGDLTRAETYLAQLSTALPANIAVRLKLIETLLHTDKGDEATKHMEELQQQMPEIPKESTEYFNNALALMKAGKADEAVNPTRIFHNFMKVTGPYQAGLIEVRSSAGPLSGAPILTFSQDISIQLEKQESILEALRFTDATESSGLQVAAPARTEAEPAAETGGALALADFDRDGDQDLYASVWIADQGRDKRFLFRNDFGRFVDVTTEAGIEHGGQDLGAIFADYDNDGFLDLFIVNSEQNRLYRNISEGHFEDMALAAGVSQPQLDATARFADLDHDGDLDLILACRDKNLIFRNNLDGTFTERSEQMGIAATSPGSRDIGFADFDNDVDLDLFLVNGSGSNALLTNLRQGLFGDITSESGLHSTGSAGAVTVGDYNNDGFPDLFITALKGGRYQLFANTGEGTFEEDKRSSRAFKLLGGIAGLDAQFFDFDNDGFLDLLVVGRPLTDEKNRRAVFLFHNDGAGLFTDLSALLPSDIVGAQTISVADYNEDGDMDIFLRDLDGAIKLLRNDGGNANKYLKMQLVGLRVGSGKNNHFGIGAKIEMRAGDLYQMRVMESTVAHFGLGQRLKADVIRILWTNGVPENLFFAGSDQDIIEQQTLKGSCAFLYAWDGEKYEFVTDVMWRSALGMPAGIMGGERAYASPKSSDDYFRIPGERLKERDGAYSLQLTEELWETAYFDKLRLITIDHPNSVEVFIDERLAPSSPGPPNLFTISGKYYPESAVDDQGNDLLQVIQAKDHNYVSTFKLGRHQGLTEIHDLVLDLGDLPGEKPVSLFLNGWIFPADASINVALSQSDQLALVAPFLQVPDESGTWRTVIDDISFPMGKDKTVIVDLEGKFITDDYRVRIRTNMQIYWDHIFYAYDKSMHLTRTALKPVAAELHYRGFSRLYRKGGRYGPHWFDYNTVSTEPKWHDLVGDYTRYGDVLPLLFESDNQYVIMNAGDEMSVKFAAADAPKLPRGWQRTFLVYTDGWIKDGDLNTASGQTVGPLPFHGLTSYPYGPGDKYPEDKKLRDYLERYNTRKVVIRPYQTLGEKE